MVVEFQSSQMRNLEWLLKSRRLGKNRSSDVVPGNLQLMHYALFSATTLLLLLAVSDRPVQARLFDLLILAIATESVQAFVRDRGASIADVAVDALGITTGFLFWLLLTRRRSRPVAR